MFKSPTVFLLAILLLICIIGPKNLLAYAPQTTHANLTDISVELFNLKNPQYKISSEEKSWIVQGSIDEDTPTRCLNHFYDPVFNKTWQLGGLEYVYPALTAKNWAQDPFSQALYDPLYAAVLGPITKSPVFSSTNFTWQRAIYEYVKGNRKQAFFSLGHILHLMEDMSVPAHTREDAHPPIFDSDIYEDYPTTFSFSKYNELLQRILNSNLTPVVKTTLDAYFDFIANYSNNYFLSSDTIPPCKYHKPEVLFPNVAEIDSTGKIKYYLIGGDDQGNLFPLAIQTTPQWRVQSGLTSYSLNDSKVLENYWQRLSQKAVLTSAGVINLFFQEVAKAKQTPDFLLNNESNVFLAAINGINTFFGNIFQKQPDYIVQTNNQTTTTYIPATTTKTPTTIIKTSVTTQSSTTTLRPVITTTTTKVKTTTTTLPKNTTTTTTTKPSAICSFTSNQFPLRQVIINEVAWMGTTNSANDEWIELKNISPNLINVSNWQLIDETNQINIIFPNNITLSPGQFLLLERTNDDSVANITADIIYVGSLANQNEGLRLFNSSCQLEDEVLAPPD